MFIFLYAFTIYITIILLTNLKNNWVKAINQSILDTQCRPNKWGYYDKRVKLFEAISSAKNIRAYTTNSNPEFSSKLLRPNVSPVKVEKNHVVLHLLNPAKLIHAICHIDVLSLAYNLIKFKMNHTTLRFPKKMLVSVDKKIENLIVKTSLLLRAGRFKFGLFKATLIPSKNKTPERRLTSITLQEKIVQKALYIVLNAVFEPRFLNYSYGFRPNRNYHRALKRVEQTFKNIKWIISIDLTNFFTTIHHDKLRTLLSQYITCDKTVALIRSGFRAGYFNMGNIVSNEFEGIPQSNILNPLLCNIFLHEFDVFMDNIKKENTKGKQRRKNPSWLKLYQKINTTTNTKKRLLLRRKLWSLSSVDPMDPNFRRLSYVRYADHFLIGLIGPRKLAVEILEKLTNFMWEHLNIELNMTKISITKLYKSFRFLGFIIGGKTGDKLIKLVNGRKRRVISRLRFRAPILELLELLVKRGYLKWRQRSNYIRPRGLVSIVNLSHKDILLQYQSVINGILTYYSCADNRSSLNGIISRLKISCALTLARKFKLRTAAKAFKAFGTYLTYKSSNEIVNLYTPETYNRLAYEIKYQTGDIRTPVKVTKSSSSSLWRNSALITPCVICGALDVELHHVNKLSNLRKRNHLTWFQKQKAAVERKQLSLCKYHHRNLHNNKLSNIERKIWGDALKNDPFNNNPTK